MSESEFSGYVSESSSFCLFIKTDGKSWSFRLRSPRIAVQAHFSIFSFRTIVEYWIWSLLSLSKFRSIRATL
jgi:hypothetical protein